MSEETVWGSDDKRDLKAQKYDAFISYRHSELDKFIAENLHKQLEAFRMPKSVAKERKGQKNKIERVFRDKEELPLTSNLEDPIIHALHNSEWLIVICSPRLRESLWCKKEIETFIELHGRERVLAVLIEGEPHEAFPEELLYKKEFVVRENGLREEILVPAEPLAADVRGKNKKEMITALKSEILRIEAAMFGLSYDDLKQRHRERRMRRIAATSMSIGAASVIVAIACGAVAMELAEQNNTIEELANEVIGQRDVLENKQAITLAELSGTYLAQGDRNKALETAVAAMSDYENLELPYTPQAHYALAEALRVYDTGNVFRSSYQYKMPAVISDITTSGDLRYAVITDQSGNLCLFDLEKRKEVLFLSHKETMSGAPSEYGFFGTDTFVYIGADGALYFYNIENGTIEREMKDEILSVKSVCISPGGKYFAIMRDVSTVEFYEGESGELINSYSLEDETIFSTSIRISDAGMFVFQSGYTDDDGNYVCRMNFVDAVAGEMISQLKLDKFSMDSVVVNDGRAYIAATKYGEGISYATALLVAYDIQSGKVLWSFEEKGFSAEKVVLSVASEEDKVLFVTNVMACIYDGLTGELASSTVLPSEPKSVNAYANTNAFAILCKEGQWIYLGEVATAGIDLSYRVECETKSNQFCINTNYGIIVAPVLENTVTFYTREVGEEVVPYEGDLIAFNDREYAYADDTLVMDNIKKYNVENPELVDEMFYSDDSKYLFVRYQNFHLAIYDTSDKTLLKYLEPEQEVSFYLGTDNSGYMYLLGYAGCYVLNNNLDPIMFVDDVKDVDLQNRIFYFDWFGEKYQAPIYNEQELLEFARKHLEDN